MTESNQPENITVYNEQALRTLARAIQLSRGQFSLILVRCNYRSLQEKIVLALRKLCPFTIQELHLSSSKKTLYSAIKAETQNSQPPALIVFGLESVNDLNTVLTSANQVREEFRKDFSFPIVLWINDFVLQRLIKLAPDFESWSTTIEFSLESEELLSFIQTVTDSFFEKLIQVGAGRFITGTDVQAEGNPQAHLELEFALQDLNEQGILLEPGLAASAEFLLGQSTYPSMDTAWQHYENSLRFWKQATERKPINDATSLTPGELDRRLSSQDRQGIVLFHMGLWWRRYAVLHRIEYAHACHQAKDYFQRAIATFKQNRRSDLEAKFINALGEILQRLECWNELEEVANRALALHQANTLTQTDSPFIALTQGDRLLRLAHDYGLLADVALSKANWQDARDHAERALNLLPEAKQAIATNGSADEQLFWGYVWSYHQEFYRRSLGQALAALNCKQDAIQVLEIARAEGNPQYDPMLYIRILRELRDLYFEQKDYLKAFRVRQAYRSIEQQYGFRAFVGAGRLQSQKLVVNPALAIAEQAIVAQEIAASGRQHDVNRLIDRIERSDCKLTVIYGQSGVGKSSILQAGFIPAISPQPVNARSVVVILQQVYTNWTAELGQRLIEALTGAGQRLPELPIDNPSSILKQLHQNIQYNFLPILVFDQFEEFFFIYKDPIQRKPFYDFLYQCLNIPYVKVILSLREDYLHYLLECNRLENLEIINNNILDKNILFYLGNFSKQDARSVIQSLADRAQFLIEPSLLNALVQDLAQDLGEVRPIELQIVGAQLQTEQITTLEQYQQNGPKEALVGRYLEEVIKDCGPENEQIAKLVLYLLTDENNTRPLKTRADLELELDVIAEKLDLVLAILVESRLVFQIPASPSDRYQLVHDYLVTFVRQQQSARLIAELEKEREQRKLTEAKLNQVLKRQLQTARRATFSLIGLVVAISGIAAIATLIGANMYLRNLSLASSKNSELERVVSAIRAGKRLQQLSFLSFGIIPETRLLVFQELHNAVNSTRELSNFKAHDDDITDVSFSPDEQLIATASRDKTVKLWSQSGKFIRTLDHPAPVTSVSFSPDGQIIATASQDGTVRLWRIDGTQISVLRGHTAKITEVAFSHDSQRLATASSDQTIRLWNRSGKLLHILRGHTGSVVSVSFSQGDKLLASASQDDTIKLWNLEGKLLKTMDNYGAVQIRFNTNNQTVIAINRDGTIKFWAVNGTLLNNIQTGLNQRSDSINWNGISLSPDAKTFAFSSLYDSGFRLVSLKQANMYFPDGDFNTYPVLFLKFSPSGKILVSVHPDNTIRTWSLKDWLSAVDRKYSTNSVTGVLYAPDGKSIFATRASNQVELWSSNGSFLKTLPLSRNSQNTTAEAGFTTDGRAIATTTAETVVEVYRRDNHSPIRLQGHLGSIGAISFSPDGRAIAAISNDTTLNLWRIDGSLIKSSTSQRGQITSFQFSPDSQLIVSINKDHSINLWSQNGKLISTLTKHKSDIRTIIFSPNSQSFVSIDIDGVANLWKRDGTFIRTLTGHLNGVDSVLYSPDSQLLISAGQENIAYLWRQDGTLVGPLAGHIDQILGVAFSPDSRIIASLSSSSDGSMIRLWHRDGNLFKTIDSQGISSIRFSPNSQFFASVHSDKTIRLWSANGNALKTLRGHNADITSLSFSPDSTLLVSGGSDNTIMLWPVQGSSTRAIFHRKHEQSIATVKFSADGKTITSVSVLAKHSLVNYTLKLWDLKGNPLRSIKGRETNGHSFVDDSDLDNYFITLKPSYTRSTNNVRFSTDRRMIGVADQDNDSNFKFEFVEAEGRVVKTLQADNMTNFSFSSDGNALALVKNQNYVLHLWNLNSNLLTEFKVDRDYINSISISPDRQTIVAGGNDGSIRLWKIDGSPIKVFKGHTDKVNSVMFSPDGKEIASASDDQTIGLWNSDGTLINRIKENTKPIIGVTFSPDNKTLVSIDEDETPKLWNRDGTPSQFILPGSWTNSVKFSLDNQMLALQQYRSLSLQLFKNIALEEGITLDLSSDDPSDMGFSPDSKSIALAVDDQVKVLNLAVEPLLTEGCNLVRDYLANKESDRHLCDGIGPKNQK